MAFRADAHSLPAPGPPTLPVRGLPWEEAFPWVIQGITTRGSRADGPGTAPGGAAPPFDLGLRGSAPVGEVLARWEALLGLEGVHAVVHARQLHGDTVRVHGELPPGLLLAPPADGHLSTAPGVLLAISVADCVPAYLLSDSPRAVGLLHAGWRGTAGGILEAGIAAFRDRLGVGSDELHLYLGPSISAANYEVGPEVLGALGRSEPAGSGLLDLRGELAERAAGAGVLPARIGISDQCTLDDADLFSHRGGDAGRQMAILGIRGPGGRTS
jgi:polyphenol oxidase